jgi:hypothetical protein
MYYRELSQQSEMTSRAVLSDCLLVAQEAGAEYMNSPDDVTGFRLRGIEQKHVLSLL